jgi:hypothetical protein
MWVATRSERLQIGALARFQGTYHRAKHFADPFALVQEPVANIIEQQPNTPSEYQVRLDLPRGALRNA